MFDKIHKAVDYLDRAQQLMEADTLRRAAHEDLDSVLTRFAEVRDLRDKLKAVYTAVNDLSEQMSAGIIPQRMEDLGVQTRHHRLGRFTVSYRTSASMTDKEAGKDWLRKNGHGDLIIETVNAQTLSAFAKGVIEEGRDLPAEYFTVTLRPSTSFSPLAKD